MSALKEFANFLAHNTANLVEIYARLLAEQGVGYEDFPGDRRIASARRLLKRVIACFEAETPQPLIDLFIDPISDPRRWGEEIIPLFPLIELECLSQTLTPVVPNLDSGKFLWHILAETRAKVLAGLTAELSQRNARLSEQVAAQEQPTQALEVSSEERYRTILESIEDGYYEVDLAGNLTFFNEAMVKVLGYPADELLGMNNRDYADEVNARSLYETFHQVFLSGTPVQGFVWQVTRKDGSKAFIEASASLMTDKGGDAIGFRGVARDITERQQAEETLAQRAAELGTIATQNETLYEQTQQALQMNEQLFVASRQLNTADDLQAAVAAVVEAVSAQDINRAVLLIFEQDAAGEMEAATVAANWHSGVGALPTPIGTRYQPQIIKLLDFTVGRDAVFFDDTRHDERVDPNALAVFKQQKIHALAALPLWVRGRQLGSLLIEAEVVHHFTAQEIQPFTALAGQLAVAVENRRLFEATEQRARELAVLNELGQALTVRLNVQEVADETYRQAARLVDTTNFYLGLYQPERHEIEFVVNVTASKIDEAIQVVPAEAGLAGYIIRTHTSLLISENLNEWLIENDIEVVGDLDTVSWLGVPLMIGEQILGVMAVHSYTTPGLYTDHDLELLTAVANQAAIAIQNAHLFEQAQTATAQQAQARQEIERQADYLQVLNEVSQVFMTEANLDAALHTITDTLVEHFEAAFARLWTVDDTGQTLLLKASSGLYTHLDGGHAQVPVGKFKIGLIAEEQQPHLTNDILNDPRLGDPEWARQEGMVAFAGYPLLVGGRLIGVLAMFAYQPISEDIFIILERLASRAAIAIDNRQLLEETQRRARREQLIREITEKMRAATSLEQLVKTTTEELGQRFSADYALLELGVQTEMPSDGSQPNQNGQQNG